MRRCTLITVMLLAGSALAQAQSSQGIKWQTDPQQAIALSQQTKLPILFYVLAGSGDRDNDIERAQRQALSDPRVLMLSQRFIPVRLSRSKHRDLLEGFYLRKHSNMEMSFVTPDGKQLGNLSTGGVANADSLSQKMALVFNTYRQQLFEQELKPIVDKADASPAELRQVLGVIQNFTIVGADGSLCNLVKRKGLDKQTLNLCYEVLAHLSTKTSVQKLLELSFDGDIKATQALTKCTPAAAETMLDQLVTEDGLVRLDIYKACAKICQIKSVKSDKWWNNAKPQLFDKEINRVTEIVRETSARWKILNEEYR
ncbi:MAG: hypothetical protein ABIG44_16775 [Planctomycetota bacterium]